MRVENGVVHIMAISSIQIADIKVWVFRERVAAERCGDLQGRVELPVHMERLEINKVIKHINTSIVRSFSYFQ